MILIKSIEIELVTYLDRKSMCCYRELSVQSNEILRDYIIYIIFSILKKHGFIVYEYCDTISIMKMNKTNAFCRSIIPSQMNVINWMNLLLLLKTKDTK